MHEYDLLIIGTGPGGEKAAAKAAYFGHKVAIIEKERSCGGAGTNTGTLPSKTLRETALYLSGKYEKGLYGIDRDILKEATVTHFLHRKNRVVEAASALVERNLTRHGIDLFRGTASFKDPHTISLLETGNEIRAKTILIATGSYPVHPPNIPFDKRRIHDSDTILDLERFPYSIAILGAGVIGLEYATIFSTMGAKVYLINRNDRILTFIDQEITSSLLKQMEKEKIDFLMNQSLKEIHTPASDEEPLTLFLESGHKLKCDMFLYAAGRNGSIKQLGLEKIGLKGDNRENIPVNSHYQTAIPNIYAVGDVIGFPALASTSMDQGRVAVSHIFNMKDIETVASDLPYGIYTIPEISTVGLSEEEAKKQNISYAVGRAYHADLPRGKIMGAESGLLKLIIDKENLTIIGVHIIGPLATELIHYGISLIVNKRTLLDVTETVYNFPTLHELYKYAAYDGLSVIAGHVIPR